MAELVGRYNNKKTGTGHDLRVDERPGEVVIWYLLWDEYQGVDDHHHMGIARISQNAGTYSVGWLRGTEQEPFKTTEYSIEDELFAALDEEIAQR